MDDRLKEYVVEIDEEEVARLKQRAHCYLLQREDKFETSIMCILVSIIARELRMFVLLATTMSLCLGLCMQYVQDVYLITAMYSALLGAGVLVEIFRMFRYHMNEIQFPTKLGMGRLFLYKMLALTIIEGLLLFLFIGIIYQRYAVDGYLLLAYGVLPNLFVGGCLLGASRLFHSLLSMLIVYSIAIISVCGLLHFLVLRISLSLLHSAILGLTLLSFLFFLGMIQRVYRTMRVTGGELSWN